MLYPKPRVQKALEANPQLANDIWQALKTISPDVLISERRVYGGGLHKMEPGELANVPADTIFALLENNAAVQSATFPDEVPDIYPTKYPR